MLNIALEYRSSGWSIFPAKPNKKPHVNWSQYQSSLPSPELVRTWWSQWPDAGVAVALGDVSGLVRVDVEGPQALEYYREWCRGVVTREFSTPSGGRGYLFQHFPGVTTEVVSFPGHHHEFRVQSTGAYTLVPPSPGYAWLNDAEIAKLPLEYLAGVCCREAENALNPIVATPDKLTVLNALECLAPSRRDDYTSWLSVLMALHSGGDEYLDAAVEWSKGSPKFKPGEVEAKWASFRRNDGFSTRSILFWAKMDTGWRSPRQNESMTDVGNANVLARINRALVKHVRKWRDWIAWDGKRWKPDSGSEVQEMAKAVVRDRFSRAVIQANKLTDEADVERKKHLLKFANSCLTYESRQHIQGIIEMASSIPSLLIEHEQLNQHPWYLNCANCTLDLKTMQVKDHDPDDMLTQLCPTAYNPEAECPRWERFMVEVFDGDEDLILWVKKLLGYGLTGVIREHILPIFHGDGRNGKSTIVRTLQNVVGDDYIGVTPSHFLATTKGEQHPTKMVELYGKRLVADLETSDGMRLDEELVKRLTGNDAIKARRMYENWWSYNPTHKLVLATNYTPKVHGLDSAIWSRIVLVPFKVSFLGREDFTLDETLTSESEGILRWMVDGCKDWNKQGLGRPPEAVAAATMEYRGEQNTLKQFFDERLELSPGAQTPKAVVTSAYSVWCHGKRLREASSKTFGMALKQWAGDKLIVHTRFYENLRVQ